MQAVTVHNPENFISRFCVCGISYQKTDASTRGQFHINEENKKLMLETARSIGIRSLFILTTCNRTEVYAYVSNPEILSELFISITNIDADCLKDKQYIREGRGALDHLFSVAAGLDSQILGDYEILGQLKQAIASSQKHGMVGPIMDRVINFAFQASKKVKTTTAISTGTTSVSFAAIEWLKKNTDLNGKKIALIGLGKFGSTVGKNMKHYFPQADFTVCNRTNEKAFEFAEEHRLDYAHYDTLPSLVDQSDIIIVSTQSTLPTVLPAFLQQTRPRVFLDLSIPSNVHPAIREIHSQRVVDVDQISLILSSTLDMRKKEVPKAKAIIAIVQQEFINWLNSYSHAPLVKEMKNKLSELSKSSMRCEFADGFNYEQIVDHEAHNINKTISRLAINLRTKNERGCQVIEAYNHFLNSSASE